MRGKNRSFMASLHHATRGLVWGILWEANIRRQLVLGVILGLLAFLVGVTVLEWLILIVLWVVVVICELINSALEALADALHPDFSEHIQRSKDLSAGAVLLMSLLALGVGLCIFLPYLLQ